MECAIVALNTSAYALEIQPRAHAEGATWALERKHLPAHDTRRASEEEYTALAPREAASSYRRVPANGTVPRTRAADPTAVPLFPQLSIAQRRLTLTGEVGAAPWVEQAVDAVKGAGEVVL